MTILWGAWETAPSPGGTSGMRVGLEGTWTTPSNGSTTAVLTVKVYTENYLTYLGDTQQINFGGTAGSTFADYPFSNSSGTDPVLRTTRTYTYTYGSSSYGSSPGSVSVSATMSGVFDGTTASVSVNYTIPARPYGVPSAPSSVAATRNSDTQATITWSRNATTGKPYSSQTIQMRTYTGGAWGSWVSIATASGTATSYVKTGLSANHLYGFRVRANNTAGSSAFVEASSNVVMTPAAPTNVVSALAASGASITTTWKANNYTGTSPAVTFTVQRSVNGAAYTTVASGLTTASWIDSSPGAGTNQYKVAAFMSSGSLTSAYTTGNIITTIVPPLAPTLLFPNGSSVDLARDSVLTWKHNPGGDNAPQTHFTIDYSSDGGLSWLSLANDVASSVSSYTIPAGTLANNETYLWRVRTEGVVSGGYGPYSLIPATFTGSATPTVTITSPPTTVHDLPVVVGWDYNQDSLSPQTAWQVDLYAQDGTTLLQTVSGNDASQTATLDYPLVNGSLYVVRVQARSGAGIWSDPELMTFDFELLPPAAITLTAEYQPMTGTTILSLVADAPVAGVTVTVSSATIERRVNGGDWTVIGSEIPVPNDFLDLLPVTNGLNEYRVMSVSASPSYFLNPVVSVVPPNAASADAPGDIQWVFLSYGSGAFDQLLRFRSEPELSESTGRTKSTQSFLGRKRPVLLLGDNQSRQVDVSGVLVHDPTFLDETREWDSPPSDWNTAGQVSGLVCYRDFTGRRLFGTLSDVKATDEGPGLGSVGFTVTEVDYTEAPGLVVPPAPLPPGAIVDGGNPSSPGAYDIDGGTP